MRWELGLAQSRYWEPTWDPGLCQGMWSWSLTVPLRKESFQTWGWGTGSLGAIAFPSPFRAPPAPNQPWGTGACLTWPGPSLAAGGVGGGVLFSPLEP